MQAEAVVQENSPKAPEISVVGNTQHGAQSKDTKSWKKKKDGPVRSLAIQESDAQHELD